MKPDFIFFLCFFGLILLGSPIAVEIASYQGSLGRRVSSFIADYGGILSSVGTVILVATASVWATKLASRASSIRETANRKISASLKIAEFRQAWIDSLREALSEFQSIAIDPASTPANERRFYQLGTKIELMMNPKDPDYQALLACMYKMLDLREGDEREKHRIDPHFVEVSQRVLKREWERLKNDLDRDLVSYMDQVDQPPGEIPAK